MQHETVKALEWAWTAATVLWGSTEGFGLQAESVGVLMGRERAS